MVAKKKPGRVERLPAEAHEASTPHGEPKSKKPRPISENGLSGP